MRKTIIYLIRHSEQLRNKAIININESDQISNEKIILTVEGEKKAEILSNIKELENVDTLWSSNYVRAIATAKYIAYNNNTPINIDSNFNERKLGNLETLKELGKDKKNNFTIEQLLDVDLKNFEGENCLEVKLRMLNSFNEVLDNNEGKIVAIVSHGAAIKFLLLEWCKFDTQTNRFIYNDKIITDNKLNSPEVFKLIFEQKALIDIEKVIIQELL